MPPKDVPNLNIDFDPQVVIRPGAQEGDARHLGPGPAMFSPSAECGGLRTSDVQNVARVGLEGV